jgi:hypothetical protein
MLTIKIVRPQEELGKDYLDRDAIVRFVNAKVKALGYGDASIQSPTEGGINLPTAPYGSVKSDDDGNVLLAVLRKIFPTHSFILSTKEYPEADDVVWHEPRMKR